MCLLVIKYFGGAVLRPLACCTRENCPLSPLFSHRIFKHETIVTYNTSRENIIFSVAVRICSHSSYLLSFIDIARTAPSLVTPVGSCSGAALAVMKGDDNDQTATCVVIGRPSCGEFPARFFSISLVGRWPGCGDRRTEGCRRGNVAIGRASAISRTRR